jgi:membrane-associated protease RseP (regulator of RpoE activity)
MLRRVLTLFVVLAAVALVIGCRESPQAGAATQASAPAAASQAPAPRPGAQAPARSAAQQEEIVVTVTLPPRGEELATEAVSGHGANCPQSSVSGLLGVEIASPHGVVIGKVLPDGLAAKAGIKPGDSIIKVNGEAITCPMTFMPYLQRYDKPTDVKLTILRPKAAAASPAPTKPAPK